MVLVSSEQRALNLQALLREQKMTTAVDFQLHELPGYGKAVIAVGGLTAGMEYPVGRFAVLTEGQSLLGKRRRSKPVTNRQKLAPTPTCLPATWWYTSTTAWAASWR